MVKYAKPRKRTEKKGLRPLSPRTIDTFSQRKMEKGEKKLERIPKGNSLTLGEKFLYKYCLVVCRFRLAQEDKQDTSSIYREICQLEKEAHSSDSKEENLPLTTINRIFRDKGKNELEELLKKLKEKVGNN